MSELNRESQHEIEKLVTDTHRKQHGLSNVLLYPLHFIACLQVVLLGIMYILNPWILNSTLTHMISPVMGRKPDDIMVSLLVIIGALMFVTIIANMAKTRVILTVILGSLTFVLFTAHVKFSILVHPDLFLAYTFIQFVVILLASLLEGGDE